MSRHLGVALSVSNVHFVSSESFFSVGNLSTQLLFFLILSRLDKVLNVSDVTLDPNKSYFSFGN